MKRIVCVGIRFDRNRERERERQVNWLANKQFTSNKLHGQQDSGHCSIAQAEPSGP